MVGEPERRRRLLAGVATVYDWLEAQAKQAPDRAGRCEACGACCDFPAYDHRLFVTPPELIYLATKLGVRDLKPMTTGRCPYQENKRCTIHNYRFAGCRIFGCHGNVDFQSELSETALKRFQRLCDEFEVPYRYQDLATALRGFTTDICQSAETPCPGDRAGRYTSHRR